MLGTKHYFHCPFQYVSRYFHAIHLLGILRCIEYNILSLGSVVGLRIPVIQSLNIPCRELENTIRTVTRLWTGQADTGRAGAGIFSLATVSWKSSGG